MRYPRQTIAPPRGQRPTIVWLGASRSSGMARCREMCESFGTVVAAENVVQADLIVLAMDRPGEVASATVDELRRRCPTAGVVTIVGTWCEGETRTGRPVTGGMRLYELEAAVWLEQQLKRFATGQCPAWGRPAARSNEERWLETIDSRASELGLRLAVCSPSPRWLETLRDGLNALGHTTIGFLPDQIPWLGTIDGLVWDLPTALVDRRQLEQQRRMLPSVPTVALGDFVREQDLATWQNIDIHSVLSKPIRLETLSAAIHDLLQSNARRTAA
ncbi:MAG: hypothetical protein JNM18_22650 [Planctomycetaceae bacterium]|nr:hypothetical protein [Planctomycetaceae bacterium]